MAIAKGRLLTQDVVKQKLGNGLTVLVKEIHAAPVAAINIWVKVGYFNEEDDEVGISHVIEHMFFKGTHRRPAPDQIAREVKSIGGELNAGTYYDFTHYYVVVPSSSLSQGLEIQSDALRDPLVDPEELRRELEAIIQEARRKRDNPGAFASEKLNELAFRKHRIRRWRIGEEEALRAFTREKLLDYYGRCYSPENIVLSVVGDVQAGSVLEEVDRRFGSMSSSGATLGASPPEPPQEEFRYRVLSGDLKRAHLLLAFRTIPVFEPLDLPTRVLATLLGKGRSSRLFREVKERRELVEGISAGTENFRDLGILTLAAELEPAHLEKATAAILNVTEGIREQGPTEAEVAKARAAVESQYYFRQSEVLGVSTTLASYEALGDYQLADEFVLKLQRVGPEEIRQAARAHLTLDKASLLHYGPESAMPLPSPAAVFREKLEPEIRPMALESPEIPEEVRRAPAPSTLSARPSPPRRLPLPGGATLLVEENPRLPVTSAVVLFRGGRWYEKESNGGISRLTLATMPKGTTTRNGVRIATEMESFGCSLDRLFNDDYLGLSISILSRYLPGGLDLLFDVMRNPVFAAEEVERERKVQLAGIEALQDQSLGYTLSLFRAVAYKDHPYAAAPYGSVESVTSLDTAALTHWHQSLFRPDRMVISVVGDRSAESVQQMLEERMGSWKVSMSPVGNPPRVTPVTRIVERIENRKREQTFLVIGFPGIPLSSPLKYPADLLQNVVSGLGGRFFEAIRGKRGLAYVVAAGNFSRFLGGSFVVYLGTSPEKEEEARKVLFSEIDSIREKGLEPEEIERARTFTLGTYPMQLQTPPVRAMGYATAEIQEEGMEEVHAYPDRIRKVDPEQVNQAARDLLTPDRFAVGALRGA